MKRDMDRIRSILLELEELPAEGPRIFHLSGEEGPVNSAHLHLLIGEGLIEGRELPSLTSEKDFFITGLTWSGHDFLDAVRSETVWAKTKQLIADKGGSFTFEIMKSVAVSVIKAHLGAPLAE